MSRADLYLQVQELGIKEKVKEVYGRNYTNCTSPQLEAIIRDYMLEKPKIETKKVEVDRYIDKLIEVLEKKHILLPSESKYIKSL